MKTVIYIPARLNSTRLPEKAIRPFLGEPLILHCLGILSPLLSPDVQVVVNTPDLKIIEMVKNSGFSGVDVYLRPPRLGTDSTTTEEILSDFVHNYCTDQDYVIAVNPTSPLLATSTVQALLSSLLTRSPDTFFSVSEIKKHVLTPDGRSINYRMWGPHPRTQDVSTLCMLNWAFVGWKTNLVMNRITCRGDSLYQGDLMLCPISDVEATDIDTPMDWSIAESLAKYLSEERSREQPT
jgi:CMP-N-acetylneuraminic acid synthetase